jgi:4a-hydroxytetrahydrobiopterin dehydratase
MNIPKNWITEGAALQLHIKCADFKQALAISVEVGKVAEDLQHHPDISIKNYNKLLVSTTTHESNSITEKDYVLAEKINSILEQQNLP